MIRSKRVSRRGALKLGAAAAALPLVHIRTAGAAGKVAIGFWDHWVPGGNDIMQKQVNAWADKNKVEVTVDFITGNGNKLMMTGVAESQAKTGHDAYTFYNWDVYNIHESLAPMDDVVKYLTGKYGAVNATAEYLAKQKGHWTAVPTSSGTQTKPPCARIEWFKKNGLDLQAMYPVKAEHTAAQDGWTWDAFLKYAELAKKDGLTFGLGLGSNTNTDAIDTHGALFASYGAKLIDENGNITLDTPEVMQVLEFCQKLVKFYPDDAVSYRRRVQQPRADLRQERADLQPAIRLGGGEARRPGRREGLLDILRAIRSQGPLRADRHVLLGRLAVQQEPAGGEGTDHLPDGARAGRGARQRRGRLRPAAVRGHARLQDLGNRRAAGRHCLQLPDPEVAQREAEFDGLRGVTRRGGAGLQPSHPQSDDGADQGRPVDQAGDSLGEGRTGRLHALTVSSETAAWLALHITTPAASVAGKQ